MKRQISFAAIFVLLFVLLSGADAFAQENDKPKLPSLDGVQVRDVTIPNTQIRRAGIGDEIDVQVENLQKLLNFANCTSDEEQPVPNCKPQKIALFLDGREIKGHEPEASVGTAWIENDRDAWIESDTSGQEGKSIEIGVLQFHLQYEQGVNDESWSDMLGGQNNSGERFHQRPIYVSVGFANGNPLPVKSQQGFNLILMHLDWRFWMCLILIILVIFYLIQLARHTELLRNDGPLPPSPVTKKKWWLFNQQVNTVHKPYSAARVQMAFWFTLVIAAFLYIWLVTGASDTITTTVLALIGIAAGTALSAVVIDKSKQPGDADTLVSLKQKESDLQNEIAALDAQDDAANAAQLKRDKTKKTAQLKEIQDLIANSSGGVAEPQVSKKFVIDVLSDEDGGMSFHRFQMLTWTLILGILFVYQVLNMLSMPEFSATLLGLLGISNGTYLGFKIPESAAGQK